MAPMPAMDQTWLEMTVHEADRLRIEIFDARGARVAVLHDGMMASGEQRMEILTGAWAPGTYFVRGMGSHGSFHLPLIVE